MESRKRQLTSLDSQIPETKRLKEEIKENVDDEDSNDSFENFCTTAAKNPSEKKASPRARSQRITLAEVDDDDSFDAPICSKPLPVSTKSTKLESGVDGFPCLFEEDNVIYLTAKLVDKREEGCIDLECVDKNGKTRLVYLQDRWAELDIEVGNAINLIGPEKWGDDDYIANDTKGIVILNPNALVPCTAVASSLFCSRKVILNDKFKFGNASNKAMLLGTIIHEIFQTAITSKKRPLVEDNLLQIWNTQAPKYAEELVALSFTPSCLNVELKPYFSVICDWINKHYALSNSFFAKREQLPSKSELLEVYDIEENIWDSKLGLKGKVDVTMRTKSKKGMESLELKTGKSNSSSEHSGQVLLYCMMQSSRYEQPIGFGNILYLKDGISRCVTPRAAELSGILQQRNMLSVFFEDPTMSRLPPPRQESRFCDKCDHKVMCSFYQRAEENYGKSSKALKEFAENEMAHLDQTHIDYVSKWIRWISAEWKCERERMQTHNKDLWLKTIPERVEEGTCMQELTPISEEMSNSQRIIISFSRKSSSDPSPFRPGDVCLLSNKKNVAIAFTVIDYVSDDVIKVSSDKIVKSRYEAPFHLDKNRLRNVLVDLLPPSIVDTSVFNITPAVKKIIVKAKLNNEQRRAIIHALSTEDYMIVEGLPGSGKTTLISVLIQCLLATNKKVLLTAFTHSAVDNILGKLTKEVSPEIILRLGSSSTINEEIRKMTLKAKLESESSDNYYASVRRVMKTSPVVACTCHHVPRELLFSYRHFDVVIVDEASMVLEPLLLPVLATSKKFVLVGDCKQLTPLVVSRKAKQEGAEVSTMEKLQKAHSNVVVSLTSQYRMNREISMLSSKLFYENRLLCGNEAVSRSSLDRTGDYSVPEGLDEHIRKTLSGDISDSCVFLDTQSSLNHSMQCNDEDGGGMSNDGEAKIISELCKRFIQSGVKPSEIGVMSAYRKQVDHIKTVVQNDSLEVNTIDSYQGREKRVIIWSLTWTDNSSKKSELLRDERRINVALTRARQKIVVVGCKKSAESIPVLYRLSQMLTNNLTIPH
ncbi:hypothetical protein GCK72_005554 [Caenorhabditis remanei]|uniref:DNA replication ATP-dependent helicase/nuclease DNA2 n=1 Tax=Caenorhabditis remanei TaxID=31234 RepID=A0A6A5HHU8_CAERE|nr:hypothetical protein GCK72_005554 [Caenorhabditis remanei]KAF1765602.1 hypothetical protein GCK72_005554 [Caenorhabditis remanei]